MTEEPTEQHSDYRTITLEIPVNSFELLMETMNLSGETDPIKFIWTCINKHANQIRDAYEGFEFSARHSLTLKREDYVPPYIVNAFKLGQSDRQKANTKTSRPTFKALEGGKSTK